MDVDMIGPYFERPDVTIISDKNFEKFIGLDAVAVSFAEGGAMGSPGEVEIVTKEGKWYKTNYAFGTIYWNQLLEVIPMLKECSFSFDEGDTCPDDWRPYDLGAGNHLFIRVELAEKFNRLTCDVTRSSQLFRRWPFALNEILMNLR